MAKETEKKKVAAKAADKKTAKSTEKKVAAKPAAKTATKTADKKPATKATTTAKKPAEKTVSKKTTAKVETKKTAEKTTAKVATAKTATKKGDSSKLDVLIKAAIADGKITDAERKVLEKRAKEEGFDKDELNMILDAKLVETKDSAKTKQETTKKKDDKKDAKDPFDGLMVTVEGGEYIHYWNEKYLFQPSDKRKKARDCYRLESKTIQIKDFKICKYPVSQALWKEIMGEDNNPSMFQGDNLPVHGISRELVDLFISKLNKRTGKKYRLPQINESMWAATNRQLSEFGRLFHVGSDDPQWEIINSKCDYLRECESKFTIPDRKAEQTFGRIQDKRAPYPIGSYKNKIGIYDLGSVPERLDPIKDYGNIGSFSGNNDFRFFMLELCGNRDTMFFPHVEMNLDYSKDFFRTTVERYIGFRIAL